MEATEERKLDFAPTASIDKVALNNKVVNMRSVVQRAKLYVINDLTKKMKKLRNKKGSDEQKEKNSQKADRLVEEMKIIKILRPDYISKYALGSTEKFSNLVMKPSTTMEQRALARLSEQKFIQEKVNGFRSEHADWKDLAAFLITKHTAREFQKKKSKEKLQKLETNVKASETLIQTYLGGKLTSIKAGKSDDSSDGDDVDDSHGATNEHLHKSDIQEGENDSVVLQTGKNKKPLIGEKLMSRKLAIKQKPIEKNLSEAQQALEIKKKFSSLIDNENDSESDNESSSEEDAEELHHTSSKLIKGNQSVKLKMNSDDDYESSSSDEDNNDSEDNKGDDYVNDDDEPSSDDEDNNESDDNGDQDDNDDDPDEESSSDDENKDDDDEEEKVKKADFKPKQKQKIVPKSKVEGEMIIKKLNLKDVSEIEDIPTILTSKIPEKKEKKRVKDVFFACSDSENETDEETKFESKSDAVEMDDEAKNNELETESVYSKINAFTTTFVGSLSSEKMMECNEKQFRTNNQWKKLRQERKTGHEDMSEFHDTAKREYNSRGRGSSRGGFSDFRGQGRGGQRDDRSGRPEYRSFSERGRGGGRGRGSARAHGERGSRGMGDRGAGRGSSWGASRTSDNKAGSSSTEKLHPSWEASRKRKEQQTGSLQVFTGKKIKFDD
ncbi:serum response factor-binding protein 1-like [Mya arenaria]|uniref:serum response factor-binding protein 1-like n=1 Tax=Mya arenaria TaxID=6604 RepID=UPI0022E7766F|nr:serum response factor-binding protein 1-like [Mya arenaria]XP_052792431.1 serum response factor-binding protein 1-like [Mya arenaria]